MLPAFLLNGLVALGFRLLKEHIASDDDTSAVEEAIVKAKSPDDVKVIVKKELLEVLDDQFLTDTDIPVSVVNGLANANNKEEIIKVLDSPDGQKSVIDSMYTFVKGITNLIFGKRG